MYWKFKRKSRTSDPMFYTWTYLSMVSNMSIMSFVNTYYNLLSYILNKYIFIFINIIKYLNSGMYPWLVLVLRVSCKGHTIYRSNGLF